MSGKTIRTERREWYRIQNSTEGATEILIYDEIGFWGVTASDFVRDLKAVDSQAITIRVNSPGGDVFEGIAILNALRSHPATITTVIDGLAASAASFIAMAGDEIVMRRNAEMMIHDPSAFGGGSATEHRDLAQQLERIGDNIASIYAERTGGTTEQWREAMLAETWYSAQEAVDAGLADRIDGPASESKANNFDLTVFNYAGRRAAPAPTTRRTRPAARTTRTGARPMALTLTDEQLTAATEALGLDADADGDAIVAAIEELATAPEGEPAPAPTPGAQNSAEMEQLRADAQQGRILAAEARKREVTDKVSAALRRGAITTARKQHWINVIEADPAMADALAKLPDNFAVPLTEIGHGVESGDQLVERADWFR